ncbi:MAG TPA: threonine synthase, partial [Burkholderiaceae bacterium]
ALPAKFAATIVEALGFEPSRPARLQGIETLPKRGVRMPADVGAVKQFIASHV